jgi:hypothetical protein
MGVVLGSSALAIDLTPKPDGSVLPVPPKTVLPAPLPDGSPKPPAPDLAWHALFDGKSLEGWKVTEFGGRGEVNVEEGAIVLGAGNDITGVTYPGELAKMNYEVELEAKRIAGGDFFCGLTFPVGEAHCTFVVGGWGGTLVGISSIDGQDASENSTSQFMKFDANRWYKIRVRVTQAKLEAWIDDTQTVDLELADRKISMRHGEIELSKPFGIASFRTSAALKGIRIRKL